LTDQQILDALAATCGQVYLAAERLGCTPDMIFRRVRRSPRIAEAIAAHRGRLVDTAEAALYRAILAGESWAVRLALTTQGQGRGYGGSSTTATEGGFLEKSGCVTVQDVLRALIENDDYLESCRATHRPADPPPPSADESAPTDRPGDPAP
jgi:hypothetical protein